ncbi:hypothetical protein BZZ01_00370 [Nostocales cyanobacterium HT-58-2]|nr:hypothetical protein BZZ01_00370 [Nostocales cyanobacterium HT-58-2]
MQSHSVICHLNAFVGKVRKNNKVYGLFSAESDTRGVISCQRRTFLFPDKSDKQSCFDFQASQAQDYNHCQQKTIFAKLRLN